MDDSIDSRRTRRAQNCGYHFTNDDPKDSKKNELKPHLSEYWKIPPEHNADFVAKMEDVLEVYARPYDPNKPVVCMDESSKQLLADVTPQLPVKPGSTKKVDDEYERKGVAEIFMAVEPLGNFRHVKITETRTRKDWAIFMKELLDTYYPTAEKVVLVMDNLNTHSTASFYETFPPAEARRLSERLEIHYTPKHGSWLDIAEIELSVFKRQALAERMESIEKVQSETCKWEETRNADGDKGVKWHFTTKDAREKLVKLYPVL